MNTVCLVILIISILVAISIFIIILYKSFNENITLNINKLNETENEYIQKIKNKYDLIDKFINEVKNKYKIENKIFDNFNKIKEDNLCTSKNDKLMNKCYKELIQIKEDNQKKKELKCFKDIINEYEDNELLIISLRTYYNKYVLEYNNIIKKFPYNIISKIKKYNLKNVLEGKELETNFNNDLEV